MSPESPASEYRRRLQHRQTTVIGGIVVVMVIIMALCLGVWTGMIPALYEPGFSSAEEEAAPVTQVCPPADAVTAEVSAIPANVYNGTDRPGLAKGVSDALTGAGLAISTVADWNYGTYDGNVLLTTSEAGLANAYTLAQAFHGEVAITIDETQDPADTTVSVVLGLGYQQDILSASEIAQFQAGQQIPAPSGCVAPADPAATGTDGAAPSQ